MRKLMLMAAMLAMVVFAMSPALAQEFGDDTNVVVDQYCPVNVTSGDFDNDGDVDAADQAEIAQEFGISQEVAAQCIIQIAGGDITLPLPADDGDDTASEDHDYAAENGADDDADGYTDEGDGSEEEAAAAAAAEASDDDDGAAELPDTGGASLLTLGAGALLVAGGLLARRIIR